MAAEPGRPTDVSPEATRPAIGEGHRQTVIVEAVRLGAVEPGRTGDAQVVAVDLDPRAECAQAGGRPGDPVGLLVAELAGAADDGRAVGGGRGEAQDRDLVDGGGHVRRTEVDGAQARRPHGQVGQRLADAVVGRVVVGSLLDVGAHRAQDVDDRATGRVDPDVEDRELGVGMDRPGDQPEGRGRDVARDTLRDRAHRNPSFDRHCDRPVRCVRPLDRHAPRSQHPFRVVARRDRLADRRPPVRAKSRQQDGGLHLCARHLRRVVDGPERGTTDHGQWWEGIVLPAMEDGTHRAQRFDDTSHRAAAQRIVTVEDRRQGQPGEHAAHQPEARPGVAAIERAVGGRGERVGAAGDDAVADGRPVALDPVDGRAERRHDRRPSSGRRRRPRRR